ncbi:two-component system sensor histidine kinase RpfC [Skermanella aerolata]|uniref:ATP-binding protein n=1 Tax=Skermanella aerolata TaxID=393310 RepID=UPI003D23AA62
MINSWYAILLSCAVFGFAGFQFMLIRTGLWSAAPYEAAGLTVTLVLPPVVTALVAFRIGLRRVRRIFAARPDSEHEQVMIRILLVSLNLAYVLVLILAVGPPDIFVGSVLILPPGFAGTWLLLILLMLHPAPSVPRRVLGNMLDMAMVSAFLYVGGAMAAPWYLIYLWVTFGNGFRYGTRFLEVSAVLGAATFALVIHVTPVWRDIPYIAYGLLVALVVLPAYVVRLIRQLTEAKAQAEAANRAKGRFLATVSHELRTPLTAIIGMGDMMMNTRLDADQREMAATVNTSARQLLSLITDVLDFSQLEEAKLAIDQVPFDLHRVVCDTRLMLRGQARMKRLALRLVIDADVPRRIVGDDRRLQQALTNLLANAVKFTERGAVTLSVRVVQPGVLEFRVTDTGIGIAPQHLDRIFDRFTQAEDDINRRYGGTGLGLAISRQLVELMGGAIGVSSELHRGSEFWITLPCRPAKPGSDPAAPPAAVTPLLVTAGAESRLATLGPGLNSALGRHAEIADPVEADTVLADIFRDSEGTTPVLLIPVEALDDPSTGIAAWLEAGNGVERSIAILMGSSAAEAAGRCREWLSELVLTCPMEADRVASALAAARGLAGLAAGASAPGAEPVAAAQRRRILVAEDNAINRRVIEKILQRAGHDAIFAADGDEALDLLDRMSFDIVLMDMNMPAISGLDVARMYRFTHTDHPHLPIVALTAEATEQARRQCADAGMDAFLTKPVDPKALFATIDRLVGGQPAEPGTLRPEPASDERHPESPLPEAPDLADSGTNAGTNEPSIDVAALDKLRSVDDDPSFIAQIADEFLHDAEDLLIELEHAWACGDLYAFKDHAHSLRSSASYVGASRMVRLLLYCRDVSRETLAEEGYRRVREIQAEFARVRTALRELA